MNTQETNTIIAEFMGCVENPNNGVWDTVCPFEGKGHHPETMKYHTSWDWLMPVVNKCFQSTLEYGEVIYPLPYHRINNALLTVNREDVYTEVVEFIKYLNRKGDAMKK